MRYDFDEFVAVESHIDAIMFLKVQGRVPNTPNIYQLEEVARIPNNFANYVFSMSADPRLARSIMSRNLSSIMKDGAKVWFIVDQATVNDVPDFLGYLQSHNLKLIEHDGSDRLERDNLLKLPLRSPWWIPPGSTWYEVYGGSGLP